MAAAQILKTTSIEDEIKVYPDMKKEYVEIFRDWLNKQPHLPSLNDDILLLQFLRRCQYSIEKAKIKLDNYLTFRTHFPELCLGRSVDHPDMKDMLSTWQHVILPEKDRDGNLVFVTKLVTNDVSKFHPKAHFKILLTLLEGYLRENGTIQGYILIYDMPDAGLAHLSKCSLTLCKQVLFFIQKCCPASVKAIYNINSSSVADVALKFFKTVAQGNMINQIQVLPHGVIEPLYKFLPREILPEEYGGNAGTMEKLNNDSYELMKRASGYISALDSLKVDEHSRRGVQQTFESLFGVEGSFRKLNVD